MGNVCGSSEATAVAKKAPTVGDIQNTGANGNNRDSKQQHAKQSLSIQLPNTFKSKYEMGNQLGKGGYSVVFEATNRVTKERFAVKEVTRANMTRDDEDCFRREIEILKSLNHPHVIQFIDFFEEKDYYYVVLELLEGGELFDRIIKLKTYNEKDARDLCNILFRAMKYCHDNNIIHRDLKPENLLLTSRQDHADVKVADFGFAKRCDGNSLTTMCGSPTYIAPEILERKQYGLAADMWSLGVITYILLGGYPPFYDNDQAALYRKIRRGVFKFHPKFWDHISPEAKELIQGMLVVDPKKRFTIDQVLCHPWVNIEDDDLAGHSLDRNLVSFRKFYATRKLRGAVKAVMALNRMKSSFTTGHSSANGGNNDMIGVEPLETLHEGDESDWMSNYEKSLEEDEATAASSGSDATRAATST